MNFRLVNRRTTASIARLLAVSALALGGLAFAGTAGAQDECGTYGPACDTSGGPDSGALPDSANTDVGADDGGLPPSSPEDPPSSPGDQPSPGDVPRTDGAPIASPTGAAPAPTAAPAPAPAPAPATPIVAGTAQPPTPGQLGRTGTSASTIAIVAGAVVLVGSALVLGARRRKQV